jgi:hypothetical protein
MRYETVYSLSEEDFKRSTGVQRSTFIVFQLSDVWKTVSTQTLKLLMPSAIFLFFAFMEAQNFSIGLKSGE